MSENYSPVLRTGRFITNETLNAEAVKEDGPENGRSDPMIIELIHANKTWSGEAYPRSTAYIEF